MRILNWLSHSRRTAIPVTRPIPELEAPATFASIEFAGMFGVLEFAATFADLLSRT
jgi:hypothetical protein